MTKLQKSYLVVILVLIIDQVSKIWVKTNMYIGEDIPVFGDWFLIHFIENPGMAFGMQFWGDYGKVALSLLRIVAVFGIGWYVLKLIKEKAPTGLVISFALIMGGALGNIIDSAFYGLIFNNETNVSTMFHENGGYGTFLHGKVVDMFYFPIIKGRFPDWMPFWSNEPFEFFRPVFNIADAAISVGVFSIVLFYRKFFKNEKEASKAA